MTLRVRELPSLRQYIELVTPSGRRYRWAEDEPSPANVPSGQRHSSTMPGGHESCDVVLPRKPGVDYTDLERLSTMIVGGAGGEVAGEFRLERTPRVSGDQMAISPSAVGWQAHLDDDKSPQIVYVDRDMGRFYPSRGPRSVANAAVPRDQGQFSASIATSGILWDLPAAELPAAAVDEIFYRVPNGVGISKVAYRGATSGTTSSIEAPQMFPIVAANDTSFDAGIALTLDDTLRVATLATIRDGVMLRVLTTAIVTPAKGTQRSITKFAAYGNHGLTTQPIDGEPDGVLASDVVAHAVGRWAPLLTFVVGETILPSTFVIPHLALLDPATVAEIVRQATRFGLQDWAVWDDKTFWWHERGAFGRKWRARIAPAQLEETGPQVDRLWESVIVQYQDVDGSVRTVGPLGSGADTTSELLKDDDPENPANKLGIIRRDMLTMGVSTPAGAIEVGRRFLEEQKLLDSSGRAQLVGHVEDDRGALHPYWKVRAGDQISFVDAADPSYRRIVRADHTRSTRSCSIDLDAPPDGLTALLERLGVVLVPLGL